MMFVFVCNVFQWFSKIILCIVSGVQMFSMLCNGFVALSNEPPGIIKPWVFNCFQWISMEFVSCLWFLYDLANVFQNCFGDLFFLHSQTSLPASLNLVVSMIFNGFQRIVSCWWLLDIFCNGFQWCSTTCPCILIVSDVFNVLQRLRGTDKRAPGNIKPCVFNDFPCTSMEYVSFLWFV